MTVSIIIAAKTWQRNLEECVAKCQKQDFPDFETLVFPDEELKPSDCPSSAHGPVSVFPTGPVCPADKRDLALKYARGEILAFIDDDAYPARDWLKRAVTHFENPEVAAVGGPALTPPEDNLRQKASGRVFSSVIVSGPYVYRYLPLKPREVRDFPSCNFLIRKSVLEELGGFQTCFWPGEDTKLCLDVSEKLNKKIIYDPQVLVWHHRRPLYAGHLRQVARYALHRGYFAKKYPQTSRKLSYFLPSLFMAFLCVGALFSFLFPFLRGEYLSLLFLYAFLVFIFSISKELRLIPLTFSGIILTHAVYAFFFMKGLFSRKLKEDPQT